MSRVDHIRTGTILVALAIAILPPSATSGEVTLQSSSQTFAVLQEAPTSGYAAFAVSLTSGLVLHENQADAQLPPASTAKLITALTAKRILDLNEQVVIVEGDLVGEDFSKMGVNPADVVTIEQLLYGALVPSGGEAARALARAGGLKLQPDAADPVERFVIEMNAVAASIGMTNSSFANPVGRDDERSWTTARDLVRAGQAVLNDPLLSQIVATPWASMIVGGPAEREIIIENTNQFVLFDDAIGIKTGTTDAAGQNLVSAFQFGTETVVTVVLGSADRYADTTAILDAVQSQWTWIDLGLDSPTFGARDEAAAQNLWMPVRRTVIVPTNAIDRVTSTVAAIPSPGMQSQGTVSITLDGSVLAELPLYTIGQPAGQESG